MLTTIWQDFLKIVREEAGNRVVETWLNAVVLREWNVATKTVYIEAPNQFVKEWIQSKYELLFQVHLGRLFNCLEPRIIFISKTDENKMRACSLEKASVIPALQVVSNEHKKQVTNGYSPDYVKRKQPLMSGSVNGKLNPLYNFDTFVVGSNNSLAYAAAQAVVVTPGTLYNPLFMYGGSGLGKTHLLHAIGNALLSNNSRLVVLYQTADRFVNEFINAIRFNKIHQFHQKYRDLDVLLIDDIQFISNKEQTQEAFFHIFNMLYDNHKQIVFSSDVFPRYIKGFAERLRSRLEWGLVTDIHKPALETKIAILKEKAVVHGHVLDDALFEYIAQQADSNVRELEGALIRIIAFASLTKQSITLEIARKVLKGQENDGGKKSIDFEHIATVICKQYGYTLTDLRSASRAKDLSFVRQLVMFFMKKMTEKSLREIGVYLGRKDHTTVIHAFEKVERLLEEDVQLHEKIKGLEQSIKSFN